MFQHLRMNLVCRNNLEKRQKEVGLGQTHPPVWKFFPLNPVLFSEGVPLPSCYTLQTLELKDQKNKETASEFLFSEQHIYKNWDYRCLVPNSHKDPTKWKTYEMHDYRRAFDKETLKSVDQFKYDNNFFNWVDPKVLKFFARKLKRAWKKTYGFPYSIARSWDGQYLNTPNMTKCFIKCAHYVREAPLNRNTCVVGGLVG